MENRKSRKHNVHGGERITSEKKADEEKLQGDDHKEVERPEYERPTETEIESPEVQKAG